jgi:catechol 1,2-dioxygenase
MLLATGRHPMRPAHIHFRIDAPGYESLTTALYSSDDPYVHSDAVFGVKPSLVIEYVSKDGGYDAARDFVLIPRGRA